MSAVSPEETLPQRPSLLELESGQPPKEAVRNQFFSSGASGNGDPFAESPEAPMQRSIHR